MPHADADHGLRVQLAAALREREQIEGTLASAFEDLRESEKRADAAEAALAAARRECEGLKKDVAALLPMAERALRDEMPPPGCAGPRDDGRSLEDSLRVAREGALLLRLRHPEIAALAALAAPAAGEEGK